MFLPDLSIRVILVAHYPVVSVGLRKLLDDDGVQIVGEARGFTESVALVRGCAADIVIVDPDSEEVSLLAVGALADACRARILVFTAQTDPRLCARAMELGASGVVCKDQPREMLIRALRKVHAGELWLDRAQTASVLSHAMRRGRDPEVAKIETLTKREREIVAKVGEGLRNGAIAEQLFISEATVRNHLTSILAKLGLSDRFELAVYAYRHDLVTLSRAAMGTSGARVHFNAERPSRDHAADRGRGGVPLQDDSHE